MAIENQTSITRWAVTTFGARDPLKVASRALKETGELFDAIVVGLDPAKIVDECADNAVMYMQIAELTRNDFFLQVTLCEQDPKVQELLRIEGIARLPSEIAGLLVRYVGVLLVDLARCQINPRVLGMIGLLLETLVHHYEPGVMLVDAVQAKMVINRSRKWAVDDHGRGQHIEEPAP